MPNESKRASGYTIAPWLSVRDSAKAVEFYKAAFGAVELYRLDDPSGSVVSRLSINGAEFWVGDESPEHSNFSPQSLGGATIRLILMVADPDGIFLRALKLERRRSILSEKSMAGNWAVLLILTAIIGKLATN